MPRRSYKKNNWYPKKTAKAKLAKAKVFEAPLKIERPVVVQPNLLTTPNLYLPPLPANFAIPLPALPFTGGNNVLQLLHMLASSSSKETLTALRPEPLSFHLPAVWPTPKFKNEFDAAEKGSPPQYANLGVISTSSSESNNLILRQIQLPKTEPVLVKLNQCASCNIEIVDKQISVVDGKSYHHQCLRCAMCETAFDFNDKCYIRDGSVLCRADHAKKYQKCCRKCDLPLNKEDIVMKAKEIIYHNACFVCFICGTKLNTGDYYTMSNEGHLYCQAHYNVLQPQVLCEEPATTVPVVASPPKTTPVVVAAAPPAPLPTATTPASTPAVPEPQVREPSTEGEGSTDEDGSSSGTQRNKRMRTSFKHHQLRAMKHYFSLNHNPDAKDLKQLAAKTNLTKRVLQVWFQNARAKYRRGLHEGGRSSPPCVSANLAQMDLNTPLSSSTVRDGFPLTTPPLATEIYSPNTNYTHL